MSGINSDSGLAESEHKPEPMTEAGCEGKVDRSVSWTALWAGFAELRARAIQQRNEAQQAAVDMKKAGFPNAMYVNGGIYQACITFLYWLDDIEADAKDASKV